MPKRGDIVLIPFPFSDLSGQKIRPALVLSKPLKGSDIIVVFITTKHKSDKNFAITVNPTKQNGIKLKSVIVCDKIATLDKKIVLGCIGKLEPLLQSEVNEALTQVLGL